MDKPAVHQLSTILSQIDPPDFAHVEPQDLVINPLQVPADTLAAGRALVYARSQGLAAYDTIGFRTFAASPARGPAPLQTSARGAMQRALTNSQRSNTVVDEILRHQPRLRHRPLALPRDGENYRSEIDRDAIHLYRRKTDSADRELEDRWSFSLTDPPEPFLLDATDRDEPMIATQQFEINLQGTHWLPFPVLLDEGFFGRFQDMRSRLVRETRPGSFYCFLSHRWLDPKQPDPDARQARFAAWQLLAHLSEAVRVANQRGLHQARQFSSQLGVAIGPRGSGLAESLIVNVLRSSLDSESLAKAATETLSLESELADYGVANAEIDTGLNKLNRLLSDRPILRELTDSIYLWYDYSCLPQAPRESEVEDLFNKGLEELPVAQIIGRTSIMLDDADDYLSRAWCTLEALVADTGGGATDLLVGSQRLSTAEGDVEYYFETLLQDRPHVVWRAILDTELFKIQSSSTCMERLGLGITDSSDLPFIYEKLSNLGAPAKIHIDDSEIVTGVLPLPAFENGTIAMCARQSGRSVTPEEEPIPSNSLDWTNALSLQNPWYQAKDSVPDTSPSVNLPSSESNDTLSCHVAVVGASEGEAIMLADWVRHSKTQLESLCSVSVTGISWLSSDIAPIGHMATGSLQILPVTTDVWAVVATSSRLRHCKVTGLVIESLKWSGIPYITVAIDHKDNNVEIRQQAEPPEGVDIGEFIAAVDITGNPHKVYPGGLFQWQVQDELL